MSERMGPSLIGLDLALLSFPQRECIECVNRKDIWSTVKAQNKEIVGFVQLSAIQETGAF